MSMQHFLEVMKARWIGAVVIWAMLMLVTLGISLLIPKQFTATASVLVDVKNADPLSPLLQQAGVGTGYMATQTDVVASERVARKVIEALRLDQSAKYRRQWQLATEGMGDYHAWLAQTLLTKLEVLPTRESGVMWISFTSRDPQEAADIANAYVQAYIGTALELRNDPARSYTGYFDERAARLSEALRAAQAKLSSYQREKGLLVTDERLDIENARLSELSTQLVGAQAALVGTSSRQRQVGVNAGGMSEVMNSPMVASMNAELARAQLRLNELRQRMGDQHPQVLDAVANVDQLRNQIAIETRRAGAGVGSDNQVNQSRVAQISAMLQEQRARVLQLRSVRDGASVLVRDVESAQRAYDAVQSRASQASLEGQNTQTNVSVLKQATLPVTPSWPKTGTNLGVAAVLGMLFALALTMLRELSDRRLRTAEDVMDRLKLPLLVTLPKGKRRPAAGIDGPSRALRSLLPGLRPR